MFDSFGANNIETKDFVGSSIEQFWPSNHRSHSFSIQWHSFWHFFTQYFVHVRREIFEIGLLLCRAIEYEAHFCVRQSSLYCLFVESILLARYIESRNIHESGEIGDSYHWRDGHLIWAFYPSNSASMMN